MRKQFTLLQSNRIRFKRWSRKGYAAFISIQHAVTIGQLSAQVSERLQVKNSSSHSTALASFQQIDRTEKEEEKMPDLEEGLFYALLWLLLPYPILAGNRMASSYTQTEINQYAETRKVSVPN